MFRYIFIDIVLPLLLFLFVRAVLKNIFGSGDAGVAKQSAAPQAPPVQATSELKKDPVCGIYVSAAVSLTRTVNGQVLHFCSPECRDKYHAA
jgi:YHS domain-containing protein